jgi:hypothetical protein
MLEQSKAQQAPLEPRARLALESTELLGLQEQLAPLALLEQQEPLVLRAAQLELELMRSFS